MERGIVSAEHNKQSGSHNFSEPELVRLAIARRIYTRSHMDYVAEKIIELHQMSEKMNGLSIAWEPPAGSLRFLMRFTP